MAVTRFSGGVYGAKLPAGVGAFKRPKTVLSTTSASLGPIQAPVRPGVDLSAPAATQIGPAPLPPDPSYDATVAAAARRRDRILAQTAGDRTRALSDFGYREQGGALAFDASNPFSRAAVLKRNYEQNRTGNINSYAARGQLYAGSLQNAQDATNRNELQDYDALMKALTRFLAQNTAASTGAAGEYEDTVAQADAARVQNAPSSPLYEPIPDSPAAAAPVAAKAAPKPGYQFVQTVGTRAGLSYKLVPKNGTLWRLYENGDLIPR